MSNSVKHLQYKTKIEKILKKHPKTRDSDKHLFLAVLDDLGISKAIGAKGYSNLYNFLMSESVPSMDTVSRLRRKIQGKGNYLPSNDKRKKLADKFREEIKNV